MLNCRRRLRSVDYLCSRSWILYAHILKTDTNKCYIGITGREPEVRWQNGTGYVHCSHFYNAIKKYGFDAFNHIILLDKLTRIEAETMERYFISVLRSKNYHLYNICSGGKVGDARLGYKNTPEHNQKIGDANRGRKLNLSETQRDSIRQRCKDKKSGWYSNPNNVSPLTKLTGKLNYRARSVYVFDLDWVLLDHFDTIQEASNKYHIASNHISACCRGRLNKTHGYRFSYYEEDSRALS